MKSLASSRKLSSAVVGAKSIRACDSCVKKRARLYCAADDAFLCQSCDASVHSANTLARRHKRVRLKTGTESNSNPKLVVSVPTWHQGFTRKARTPRLKKHANPRHHPEAHVPEICSEEQSRQEDEEEDLHFRVPVFDPLVPSEMDVDVEMECLLGTGMEDESFNMEELGLLESRGEYIDGGGMGEDFCGTDVGRGNNLEVIRDDFRAGPRPCESEKEEPKSQRESTNKTFLKLDFGRVMSEWDGEKSPWINGEWPEMSYGEFSSTDFIGTGLRLLGHGSNMFGHPAGRPSDGDREARVSRYREKRRTRLFSKKIRYEVRKLNAEKRPRMKGRFIKRSN